MPCPNGLTTCSIHREGELSIVYRVDVVETHPLAEWLFDECEGPWAVGMRRPYAKRERYLAFSRPADAFLFRLMQT